MLIRTKDIATGLWNHLTILVHEYPLIIIPLIKIVCAIIAVFIINTIIRKILNKLSKIPKKEIDRHDNRIHLPDFTYTKIALQAINGPLRAIIWFFSTWFIIGHLPLILAFNEKNLTRIGQIVEAGTIICLTWAVINFTRCLRLYIINQQKRTDGGYDDFSAIQASFKIIQVIIIVIAIITIMSIANIPIYGLLTVGGVGGAAIAFANQQLIANIFSGFAIYFDRPFSVGDWIYTSDGKIEGTVERIGLRLTKIRGFDKRPIYVPNSEFNTNPTVNASRMTNRRIKQYIGVRYEDFHLLENIIKDIKEMLKSNPHIDQKMITLVNLVNGSTNMGSSIEGCFGNSSINFQVYTFTKVTNWVRFQGIQDEVMFEIGKIIEKHGAEIAFPCRTIYMKQ